MGGSKLLQANSYGPLGALLLVVAIGLVTWATARWIGARLKGKTRWGLHDLERLAAPVSLLVLGGAADLVLLPISIDPPLLAKVLELLAIAAAAWLGSRLLDVASATARQSSRLRATPAAREIIVAGRQVGKVVVILTGATALAVRLGAAEHLYLVLGGLGAAAAFAARQPLRNAIAFASMVLDPPYHVGDRIRVVDFRGGEESVGEVVSISLSSTTLLSDRRTHVVISNTVIGQLRVENLSSANRHRLEVAFPVSSAISSRALREACDAIERDLAKNPHVSDHRPPRVWLSGRGETLHLKASAWLRRATSRREAQRDLLLLVRAHLAAAERRQGKKAPGPLRWSHAQA